MIASYLGHIGDQADKATLQQTRVLLEKFTYKIGIVRYSTSQLLKEIDKETNLMSKEKNAE